MKISVVIITRNRKEDVRRSIGGYLRQTYENKEIIVVDNASDDGTREMMRDEFSDIKYMWLPDNFDIRSINLGVELSTGEIIWRTDSDSFPESENAFEMAAEIFQKHPEIDIISTEDIEVRKDYQVWEWYPLKIDKTNIPDGGFKANFFPGTGAAIKRKVFNKIGGFWEFGFEELDFCTRAILAGFNVRYFPNIRTLHWASPLDRNQANRWVLLSKQFVRYTWRYFPFSMALSRTLQIFCFQMIMAVISKIPFLAILEGIFSMITVVFSTYRNERNVVPKKLIPDITLGVSIAHTQMRFFAHILKSKLKFHVKNGG